jgi:hypothetical protein
MEFDRFRLEEARIAVLASRMPTILLSFAIVGAILCPGFPSPAAGDFEHMETLGALRGYGRERSTEIEAQNLWGELGGHAMILSSKPRSCF